MEKTTKKRKKSKRLKRRIGLIAVGGLSFVLTICLSVGATLAWFAGSTWASNDLYMGGPVYVEMAGRGENSYETGTDNDKLKDAKWKGGAGTLDIIASSRSTGTVDTNPDKTVDSSKILLPGQKLLIYSQARVYSTLETTTVDDGSYMSNSSGANNSNTNDGTAKYYEGKGRVQSTTTSVLRAKFSINIEFDPSVGFNNFTDKAYAEGYPVQSKKYVGEYGGTATEFGEVVAADDTSSVDGKAALTWDSALGKTAYTVSRTYVEGTLTETENGRRDAVAQKKIDVAGTASDTSDDVDYWVTGKDETELKRMKAGTSKCIYKWKYVSEAQWKAAGGNTVDGSVTAGSAAIGKPFNGRVNTAGGDSAKVSGGSGNGFYAIWVLDADNNKTESEAFYKARTEAYMNTYKEHYVDDYDRDLELMFGVSLPALEDALNKKFRDLITESSDNIWAGNLMGFDAETDGRIVYDNKTTGINASWLYVDPTIGNDTNSGDSATSVGGWWYLVENTVAGGNKSGGNNTIVTEIDNVVTKAADGSETATGATTADAKGIVTYNWGGSKDVATNTTPNIPANAYNKPKEGVNFQRTEDQSEGETGTFVASNDKQILTAKLYEIVPNLKDKLVATDATDGTTTTKVVSVSFPFVNGNFELPEKELTNVFANARISFQITFQALQAFFPFSSSIDTIPSGTAITGTGKALNIGNAIPIFNEAFDYLSYLDTSTK